MTCIVGFLDSESGDVCVAGDSLGASGTTKVSRKDPKVFVNGEYLIGFTTSFRMGQLLQFADLPATKKKDRKNDESIFRFMVTEFIPAVRGILKKGGFASLSSGVETGGTFVVGLRGHIFSIGSDFQVESPMAGYVAVGCGWEPAIGSLYTLSQIDNLELSVTDKAMMSLGAAQSCSAFVEGPFLAYTLISNKKKAIEHKGEWND